MSMVITKEWFTVEEAAEYLCVSKRTIYKLTKEGRLPAFRIGKERHRRFQKESLDKVPRPDEGISNAVALLKLSAEADPVLAEAWNNEKDAAYDRITPVIKPKLTLKQLLAKVTTENLHSEVSTGPAAGNETW